SPTETANPSASGPSARASKERETCPSRARSSGAGFATTSSVPATPGATQPVAFTARCSSGRVYDTEMRILKISRAWGLAALGAALLSLATSGAEAGLLSFLDDKVQGMDGADGLDVAVSIAVSPDGRHIYVAGYGDNAVSVFARIGPTGIPLFLEVPKDGVAGVDGLLGAYSVAVSPDGKHVYVAGNLEDAIAVFSRDAMTGHLTFVEVEKNGVGGVAGLAAIDSLTLSPDGKHVYAAGYNDN